MNAAEEARAAAYRASLVQRAQAQRARAAALAGNAAAAAAVRAAWAPLEGWSEQWLMTSAPLPDRLPPESTC